MEIDFSIIEATTITGNLPLLKYFHSNKRFSKDNLFSSGKSGNFELVKYIPEQEGIDIVAKDIQLFFSNFISIIWYFKIIFGIFSNYYAQHLLEHL